MADSVASQTIDYGHKYAVIKLTNVSDGTGESAVTKVDVSGLASSANGVACTGATKQKIWGQCTGMNVSILYDATSDVLAIQLGENQSGYHEYTSFGGLTNNDGSGKTGDVQLTTVGHASGETYAITITCVKEY